MDLKSLCFVIFWMSSVIAEEDWTKQCNKCGCIWAGGKRTANCSSRNLNEVPKDLSSLIKEIDFSNNPIYSLRSREISHANLRDIHKLKFHNCSIELVDRSAFNDLALLVELDLSNNRISSLSSTIFRHNIKLKMLYLSYNNISVIEDELFCNMSLLQEVHLDHNQIEKVSPQSFKNLNALNCINLSYNKIKSIIFDLKKNLPRLYTLNIQGNPWTCDCHLEELRQSALRNNLLTAPTECDSPVKLKGRKWQDNVIFSCIPKIIEPFPSTSIQATSTNVTLSCKVTGEPTPDVDWMNNGHIIERDPRKNKQKYISFKNKTGDFAWNNLTIINVNYRDRGDYKCIAKNPGGEDETNITLIVPPGPLVGGGAAASMGSSTLLIIGLSIGLLLLLLIILLLVCCFCKKNNHGLNAKRREHADSSEEYISMSGGQAEIKKGLITDVNPVTKPPRATVPPSVVSGGTEVSDVKRNLLDNESMFDGDDESRSLDFDQPLLRKSQILLDSPGDYRLNNHYPPDLLPFPPRAVQVSPAASSASTVADTTRLPSHHGPQSPLHSPIYDQLNLYRTLPYSRSHSPFVGPPPRIPRQGYVTIPRRPRQQSWSSEPPNVSEIEVEPLYDNLGKRTTATGASVLSLNKLGETTPASTPRSNRMFPMSPTNCDPIDEIHESPPSQPVSSQTLPRNMNSNKLTPSRTQWAKANAEALRSPEKRNSTASLPTPGHLNKLSKIPPTPPPKPKKRLSTGPLFEDEGEDGTEV